jgi:DNA-directed RNA polymerase specialized sigma24 family protein
VVASLFASHAADLGDLAVAAGHADPAEALTTAFAELYERFRDIPDPLTFLRRQAVVGGSTPSGAALLLRTHHGLTDDEIADVVGVAPASVRSLLSEVVS